MDFHAPFHLRDQLGPTPYGSGLLVRWGPTCYSWPWRLGYRFYVRPTSDPQEVSAFYAFSTREQVYLTKAGARSAANSWYRNHGLELDPRRELRTNLDRQAEFFELLVVRPCAFDQRGRPIQTHDPLTGAILPNYDPRRRLGIDPA